LDETTNLRYDVYIAGAMHGRMGFEVLDERDLAKYYCRLFGLTYYDPAEDEKIDRFKIVDANPNLELMRHYVEKDERNLDKCRGMLVLTGDKSTSGTAWEMARMYYKNCRPIVAVAPRIAKGQLTNFTAVKIYAYETIREAVLELQKRINGDALYFP